MALVNLKSDLAQGVGSKQSPQSFVDGHSSTIVTGNKEFTIPPRFQVEKSKLTSVSRQSETLTHEFNDKFLTKTIKEMQVPGLQKYYDRAFNNADRLGARFEQRLGFDEPFIIRGIGDRWGPGGLGKLDLGLVRAGAVTQASRTVADVQRIGKFLLTPRGVGFVLKQNILQKMNANGLGVDGVPQGGSLVKKIGDVLGGKQPLPGPKQQRFNTGRDVFQNRPYKQGEKFATHTVDELVDSDIRTWRATSIIDSLPIGAHGVRHLQPAGSPSVQLVKNIGNFVVQAGDGVLSFMDGIDVAFPHISLNPSFQSGDILTGVGRAVRDGIGIFPNVLGKVGDVASGTLKKIGKNVYDALNGPTTMQRWEWDKSGSSFNPPQKRLKTIKIDGRLDSLSGIFGFLTEIPTPRVPNLSGLQSILAGVTDTTVNILKGIGGAIKLPSISLPPIPKLPALPNISLSGLPNPFTAIGNAAKGVAQVFPKFAGKGGLGIGSISVPDFTGVFPSIRLNADITPGFFQTDLSAFGPGGSFRDGLQELIKSPAALGTTPANAFAKETVNTDKLINDNKNYSNENPYGVKIVKTKSQMIVGASGGKSTKTGQDRTVDVNPIYTTYQPSVANDFRGGLTNIFDKENNYSTILVSDVASDQDFDRKFEDGKSLGISWDDKKKLPFAVSSGFVKDINGASFPLNVKAMTPVNKVEVKFPKNVEAGKSGDEAGKRLQKYEMLSYGQITEANRYENSGIGIADIDRKLGSQGGSARVIADMENGMVRMASGDGKSYKTTLADGINLHPYGGSLVDANINDNETDFIPFKFRDMVNGKWIIFRAILESVADTSSPEYAEESYIGRPDKVFTYRGTTRNFNVTFKVAPKTVQEMITLWEKLNYLRGLTYPSLQDNRMIAPFASVTVGDLVDKLPVLLQSLNYTIDTASTWEIKPGLRLPKLIQVSADMRVVSPKLPQATGKFYDLDWLSDHYEWGTFDRDPKLPASLKPNRTKFERGNHTSNHKWVHLFDELGIQGVNEDIMRELKKGDAAVEARRMEWDKMRSDLNVPNADIPSLKSHLNTTFSIPSK